MEQGLVLLSSGVIVGIFSRMLYIKVFYPYEGVHKPSTVVAVPSVYHPSDVSYGTFDPPNYRELWMARLDGRLEYLFYPIDKLPECTQRSLEKELSNWKWKNYSTNEWPLIWREDNNTDGVLSSQK